MKKHGKIRTCSISLYVAVIFIMVCITGCDPVYQMTDSEWETAEQNITEFIKDEQNYSNYSIERYVKEESMEWIYYNNNELMEYRLEDDAYSYYWFDNTIYIHSKKMKTKEKKTYFLKMENKQDNIVELIDDINRWMKEERLYRDGEGCFKNTFKGYSGELYALVGIDFDVKKLLGEGEIDTLKDEISVRIEFDKNLKILSMKLYIKEGEEAQTYQIGYRNDYPYKQEEFTEYIHNDKLEIHIPNFR